MKATTAITAFLGFMVCGLINSMAYAEQWGEANAGNIKHILLYATNPGPEADVGARIVALRSLALYKHYSGGLRALKRSVASLASAGGGLYGVIHVGSGTQKATSFRVNCDTGSDALWLPAASCASCAANSTRFDPAASPSFAYAPNPSSSSSSLLMSFQSIYYGTGSVQGILATDTVLWAGLTSPKQSFLLVTSQDAVMAAQMANVGDGIMGLAFAAGLDPAQSGSILSGLAASNAFPAAFFSLWINKTIITASSGFSAYSGGLIILGGIDTSLYSGNFSFFPLAPSIVTASDGIIEKSVQYYWSLAAYRISIPISTGKANTATIIPAPKGTTAIIDLGTTLMILDAVSLNSIVNSLQQFATFEFDSQNQLYFVSCKASLPDISFSFDGTSDSFHVGPGSYLLTDGQNCALGIQAVNSAIPQWIFGQVFLQNYYTVFDFENKQVGFAIAVSGNSVDSDDVAT
ncbi:hypothetical protein HK100_006301, partial [Physocladia obscura]